MTWIGLYDGGRVDLVDPRPEQFDIGDIARGLSCTARFNGHTHRFYSVAQHSRLMSELINPDYARWALLHDASEAYLGDLVRPLKELCPDYRRIEERIMRVIAERFELGWPMPPEVKAVDNRMLVTEKLLLQPGGPEWGEEWANVSPYPHLKIYYERPENTELAFLRQWAVLNGETFVPREPTLVVE